MSLCFCLVGVGGVIYFVRVYSLLREEDAFYWGGVHYVVYSWGCLYQGQQVRCQSLWTVLSFSVASMA